MRTTHLPNTKSRVLIAVIAVLVALAALVAITPTAARADEVAPKPASNERGRALFAQYCAGCHGGSGRGDGPIADALKTRPPDLTRIAARRGGQFPVADIVAYVDGRTAVLAHGNREMPVWGERFAEEAAGSRPRDQGSAVSSKLRSLVEHLQSIQAKPTP